MAITFQPPARSDATGFALAMVLLSSAGFGLVPLFAKMLIAEGLASHAIAFHRYAITAVVFLPWLWFARRQWRALVWGLVAGFLMGVGWVAYVEALKTAPVSTLAVIYMTYPVFTLLIGFVLFRERPSRNAIIAAALVVLAASIASSPAAVPVEHWPVLALALLAPFGFGFAITSLVYRLHSVPPIARIASTCLGSFLGLLPLILVSVPNEVVPQTTEGWIWIFGIALGTALIPQLLYVTYAPKIGAARASVAGSIELPTMFLTGWMIFGEQIAAAQWLAGALILVAMILPQTRATRNVATNLAQPSKSDAMR